MTSRMDAAIVPSRDGPYEVESQFGLRVWRIATSDIEQRGLFAIRQVGSEGVKLGLARGIAILGTEPPMRRSWHREMECTRWPEAPAV